MIFSWESIIESYSLDVTWQGLQWRGPCPVHGGDNTSSFVITPDKGLHCFACGWGGGVAAFLRLMGDAADADVVERMTVRPRDERPVAVAATTPIGPLDPSHAYFRDSGIHEATARHFGMGFFRGAPPLGRRIIAPLHDPDGHLVGHIGRAIDDRVTPRHLFQRGVRRSEILFHLHRVKQANADTLVFVE